MTSELASIEIARNIHTVRGLQIMLDRDLAKIYEQLVGTATNFPTKILPSS
jgi:hypothetical protein